MSGGGHGAPPAVTQRQECRGDVLGREHSAPVGTPGADRRHNGIVVAIGRALRDPVSSPDAAHPSASWRPGCAVRRVEQRLDVLQRSELRADERPNDSPVKTTVATAERRHGDGLGVPVGQTCIVPSASCWRFTAWASSRNMSGKARLNGNAMPLPMTPTVLTVLTAHRDRPGAGCRGLVHSPCSSSRSQTYQPGPDSNGDATTGSSQDEHDAALPVGGLGEEFCHGGPGH